MMQVIKRYEKAFGERNYQFTAGKVDFITIDAQTLDGIITIFSFSYFNLPHSFIPFYVHVMSENANLFSSYYFRTCDYSSR